MPTTNRIEKVNSLLEQEIGKIIQRDFEFSPNTLTSVTHVDTSANLIEAKVFVSVFPDEKADEIIAKLNRGVWSIQKKIDKLLKMRPIPKIIFRKDSHPKTASRVEELLACLRSQAELKNEEK